jgi:transposase-like protein
MTRSSGSGRSGCIASGWPNRASRSGVPGRHVGVLLDLNPETLRNWAEERDRVESGRGPAPRSAESEEVRALRRRVSELERANEILKTSAAFFAQAELDRRLR